MDYCLWIGGCWVVVVAVVALLFCSGDFGTDYGVFLVDFCSSELTDSFWLVSRVTIVSSLEFLLLGLT